MTYLLIFLLSLATLLHLWMDFHKISTGHPIRHWISAGVAILVSSVLGAVNHLFSEQHWWQFAIFSLGVHFALFDYLWNTMNHKPWLYNGDPYNPERSWFDKLWSQVPPIANPFLRLWVFGVASGFYYHWDWIKGGWGL